MLPSDPFREMINWSPLATSTSESVMIIISGKASSANMGLETATPTVPPRWTLYKPGVYEHPLPSSNLPQNNLAIPKVKNLAYSGLRVDKDPRQEGPKDHQVLTRRWWLLDRSSVCDLSSKTFPSVHYLSIPMLKSANLDTTVANWRTLENVNLSQKQLTKIWGKSFTEWLKHSAWRYNINCWRGHRLLKAPKPRLKE